MKQTLLLFVGCLFGAAAEAQPVLNATAINPVHGDFFYEHGVSPSVSQGAAGANITWDFSAITQTHLDSTEYFACDSTPYCGTFPGSNIAAFAYGDYEYYNASSTALTVLGAHTSGMDIVANDPVDQLRYPFVYGQSYVDTLYFGSSSLDEYYTEIDSFIYDGYGTIMLPPGTDTGVVRIHNITYTHDSSSSFGVEDSRTESYYWYKPGTHNYIMEIDYDTSGNAGIPYVTYAAYYTAKQHTEGIENVTSLKASMGLYPNPVSDVLHIQFRAPRADNITLVISDITGRIIDTTNKNDIAGGTGIIDYPVNDLPAGVYIAQLYSKAGNVSQKFTVAK